MPKGNEEAIRFLVNLITEAKPSNAGVGVDILLSIGAMTAGVLFGAPAYNYISLLVACQTALKLELGDDQHRNFQKLVRQEIQEYHLEKLQGIRTGLERNKNSFTNLLGAYGNATDDTRKEMSSALLSTYNAFIMNLELEIAQFQLPSLSVASLIDFASVANLHVTMLASGITYGKSWGFPQVYIDHTVRPGFNLVTGSGTKAPAVPREKSSSSSRMVYSERAAGDGMKMQLLSDAIQKGESAGWSAELLQTWKDAYAAFSVPHRDILSARHVSEQEDYPTYARRIYALGRTMVQPYQKPYSKVMDRDVEIAGRMRALADYDAIVVMNVLSYAEYWPYLTGEFKFPKSALDNLDREIYSGPYGRGREWLTWNETHPPLVTPRSDNITSLVVRAGESIDGVQQKSGETWLPHFGSQTDGAPWRIDFDTNEFVENINITYGHKVGTLHLTSNNYKTGMSTVYGPYGTPKHAKWTVPGCLINGTSRAVNRTGYGLSSIYCTQWSGGSRRGCNGLVFGWRPLYLAADTYLPAQNATEDLFTPLMTYNYSSQTNVSRW